jgi:hypothetical protein
MAEIFSAKERTRTEPKKPGEGEFAFYDSAGEAAYDTYRALVNGWLNETPEAERAELVARFQTGTDLQYQAALAVYNALDKAKPPAGWRLGLDIVGRCVGVHQAQHAGTSAAEKIRPTPKSGSKRGATWCGEGQSVRAQ